MAERGSSWFERHGKSKALELAQKQIRKSLDMVTLLEKALTALSEWKKKEAKEFIESLFLEEMEIDALRRSVMKEMTKGTLPIKYREDLTHLVKRLDLIADYIKDAARNIKILLKTRIPKEILDVSVSVAKALVDCALAMRDTIEKIGTDPSQLKELLQKVDSIENRIDDEFLKTKSLFLSYSDHVGAGTLLALNNLMESMENAADVFADTADYIRILEAAEEEEKI